MDNNVLPQFEKKIDVIIEKLKNNDDPDLQLAAKACEIYHNIYMSLSGTGPFISSRLGDQNPYDGLHDYYIIVPEYGVDFQIRGIYKRVINDG